MLGNKKQNAFERFMFSPTVVGTISLLVGLISGVLIGRNMNQKTSYVIQKVPASETVQNINQ